MIRTVNLTKKFRSLTAVRDLTLDVPEGAIFALVGPNGAGKTTLVKILVNIWKPDGGSATIFGVDTRSIRPADLAQIGYVSENQRLPEWMRVDEFLQYCSGFYTNWDNAAAASLVRLLHLPLDRRLSELSRGGRLKAALASVLAYRPKVLILDEPFSGLDVLVREEISETILTEASGVTVLLASHDLADLESFASHVGYLHDGELVFSEEMPSLSTRYREIEVTVDAPDVQLPQHWPKDWLNPEHSQRVIRFTDSRYDPERVRSFFPQARSIVSEPLSLRRIFVALARSRREHHDLAHS